MNLPPRPMIVKSVNVEPMPTVATFMTLAMCKTQPVGIEQEMMLRGGECGSTLVDQLS